MNRAVVILLPVVLAGCRPKPSPVVLVDPALAILVPPDTFFLAGVRLKQLRETPLYKQYIEKRNYPALDQFARETAVDPRQDVWELLVTSDGKDTAVMARGKFSESGLEPRLQREGATRSLYKGYSVTGDERLAVTFLNSTTAITGPTRSVHRIIDLKDQTRGIPGPLESKIKQIPSSNQIWFVGNVGGRLPGIDLKGNAANLANFAKTVDSVTGTLAFTDVVKTRIEAVTFTEKDAKQLADMLRGFLGFARLNTPSSQPELLRVFDSLQLQNKDRVVTLSADIPADVLEQVGKLSGTFR